MANHSGSKEFMLILRGGIHPKDLSPQQIQEITKQFGDWIMRLQTRGQLKGVGRLEDDGRRLSRNGGKLVVDGPYAESKEVVGGYFVILAADLDEAINIADGCPLLDNKGTVEVRQLVAAP